MAAETVRPAGAPEEMRIDKWLWHARFFKSRSLASRLCAEGRVRIDGVPIRKAHHLVRPGNVLTFPQAREIRVVRVEALGARRGPPREAQALYSDLAPAGGTAAPAAMKTVGSQQEKY